MGSSGLEKLFDPKRIEGNRNASSFRCQASQALSLVPVLAYWVKTEGLPRFAGNCLQAMLAFVAMSAVMSILCNLARAGAGMADTLQERAEKFLYRYRVAWNQDMTPKFHWMLHYAQRLRSVGILVACFVPERKHKLVRRYGNDVLNTPIYESTVVKELTCHSIAMLSEPALLNFDVALVRPHAAPRRLRKWLTDLLDLQEQDEVMTALVCQYSPLGTCAKGDVVLVKEGRGYVACQIVVHVSIEGLACSIVSCWTLVSQDEHGGAIWNTNGELMIVDASDILIDVIWRKCAANRACTLIPEFI